MAHVLIVDDDPMFRNVVRVALESAGYRTSEAWDDLVAWDIARRDPPDMVLLDVAMPGAGGVGLLNRMRRDPALASTPVIVVSALCQMSYLKALDGMGVAESLLKSRFSLNYLNDRIAALLASGPAGDRYAVSA